VIFAKLFRRQGWAGVAGALGDRPKGDRSHSQCKAYALEWR
jgi:hypothetical protein